MKRCWAMGYGACDEGISREHFVSKGIFDQKTIFVQGFEWCRDELVEVGLSAITRKMLCRKHNSQLEVVDRGGISAIEAFEGRGEPLVNGRLFERWLLKTALNVSFQGPHRIGCGMTDGGPGIPPPYLQAVVFGELPFTHRMGAYLILPDDKYEIHPGSISVMPIHRDGEIGGFLFHLRGLNWLLSLLPGHAPPALGTIGVTGIPEHLLNTQPLYRVPKIHHSVNGGAFFSVEFEW
ncbi:MAG: hypothetical protein AB1766_06875 [Pseudomonadota bacterium]